MKHTLMQVLKGDCDHSIRVYETFLWCQPGHIFSICQQVHHCSPLQMVQLASKPETKTTLRVMPTHISSINCKQFFFVFFLRNLIQFTRFRIHGMFKTTSPAHITSYFSYMIFLSHFFTLNF